MSLGAERIEIRFAGQRFAWWQSVKVHSSVDDLCATLHLGMTRPGQQGAPDIDANTVVDVLIDDTLVATIRPDLLRRGVQPVEHTLTLEARSLGRELVDCQHSRTLNGLRLEDIVQRLCATFGVPVHMAEGVAGTTALVPKFSMQSEMPANALINAARASNMLLYPAPDGGLVLGLPDSGAPIATLEYGRDFTSFEIIDEYKLRYSDYVVRSFDYEDGRALAHAVKDDGISYFRPMHIVAERHGQALGGCERRALLERNRRLARAHRIELTLPGWCFGAAGSRQPWPINRQVRLVMAPEGIDDVFLIGERTFERSDKTTTRLQLMHRSAFEGEAVKKQHRGSRGGWNGR